MGCLNSFLDSLNNFKNDGLSVIITAYKSQDFIEECLDSIQNQNYFKFNDNYEILLGIDACETTLKKVNEIRSKYKNLKVFYATENGGTYRMRNSLWIRAKYENLLFFDSDDVMPEEFLSGVMKHSKNKMIRFKVKTFRIVNNKLKFENEYQSYGQILIKYQLLKHVNGFLGERIGMDSDLINRISKLTNIYYDSVDFFLQRHREESLTSSKTTGFGTPIRNKISQLILQRKKDNIIINSSIDINNSVGKIK